MSAITDCSIRAFCQIRADVLSDTDNYSFSTNFIVVNSLVGRVGDGKADDDDMNVRFAARFAFPRESTMRKMDLYVISTKKFASENSGLFPLRDGIG